MKWELRDLREGELNHELLWLGVTVTLGLGVAAYIALGLPLPTCRFHNITGVACVTCGATRSALQLAQGHVVNALLFNPLVFFGLCFGIVYDVYAACVVTFRLPRLRLVRVAPQVARGVRWTAVVALLTNWIYVAIRL